MDARNQTWTYVFNGTFLEKKTDPLGNSVRYQYDPSTGDLIGYRDALGKVMTMTYDDQHNMLTRTAPSPLSYTETWTYNAFNDVTSHKDGRGNQTDFGYDSAGNLTTLTGPDPDGTGPLTRPVTAYGRDPAGTGLLVSLTDPRQKVTSYGYDPTTHDLTSITTALNERTTMTYDAAGRLRTVVEPRGNASGAQPSDYTTTFDYDNADHPTNVVTPDPDGTGPQTLATTQWSYDPAGNLQTLTDANSHATEYAYDAMNQLTSVTAPDPDGASSQPRPVTAYTYDEVGNPLTRTDANNHTTTYSYDEVNRLASTASPTGQLWTYTYDANGNRLTQTDANGNATPTAGDGQTTYGYDALGRVISIGYSDSTSPVGFAYDGNSNVTQMTDGSGSETYTYDGLNRLTAVTRGTNAFSYAYDAAGNRIQTTYPDGALMTATYDDDERLASVTSGGLTTSYAYDPAGNLTTTTLPSASGYVETRTYDRAGRLTGVTNKKGTTTLSSFAVTLDPVGNPLTSVRSGTISETSTFTYDGLDRLTGVCFQSSCPHASDPFIRWTYDGVGNRLTEARPSGTTTYTYNAADQLTQAGATSYTYDQNGDQTTAGSTTFAYDLANRLISTTTGSTTTTYAYDGLGKRLQASTGSQSAKTTNYLWDTAGVLPQIALERDGADRLLRRYVYGANRISMSTDSSPFYFHYDPLGSTVNLTNSSGASQWTHAYEPYGLVHTETQDDRRAPTNFMKFAGEYLDPTGLYHLRARQYDPTNGRFLTTDPLARAVTAPYISSYVYADNQPTALIDPSGMGAIENTCGSFVCWLKEEGRKLGEATIKVGAGCFYGGVAAEEAIGGPIGLRIALAFNPEAALALPAVGCVAGAGLAGVEVATGYEGPGLYEPPAPFGP